MRVPKLKRIKVSSERELRNWLTKNSDHDQDVMIVTCNKKSREKYVSSEQVRDAVIGHGWKAGPNYTLPGNLVGHVLGHP